MTGIDALLLYAAWTIVLVFAYVSHRIPLVLTFKKPADFWTRGNTTDDAAFFTRAHHAHLNCVENLPLFAVVVLSAVALGQTALADSIAPWVLYCRVGQSTAHLIGTSFILVLIRANLFVIQLGLIVYMIVGLV